MKKTTQTTPLPAHEVQKHTPGNVYLGKPYKDHTGNTHYPIMWHLPDCPKDEYLLAETYKHAIGEAKANAARIVQCWNEYDELKAENEQLKAANKKAADSYLSVCTELSNQDVEIEQLKASNKELRKTLEYIAGWTSYKDHPIGVVAAEALKK